MIRLTELERTGSTAAVRIEGHLTESTLQVLVQILAEYRRDGLAEVRLMADGLQLIDPVALVQALPRFPPGLQLSFRTSRLVVKQLLEDRGLAVVFDG
jgi:hypothetical protein